MIHSDSVTDVYSRSHIPIWLVSSFKAGFINSAGFLMTGKFVSHVTGFGTQVGVAVGHEDFFFGAELLLIPLSFIFGGVITSLILDKEYAKNETPPYWKVQSIITLLLALIMGIVEFFNFDIPFDQDSNYNFLELAVISMLVLVCGLKNSLVTWSTFGKIRVTHLTGLSTDIGLNLVRTFFPSQAAPRGREASSVNILRIMTFVCFSLGALISAVLFPILGMKGLIIPLVISTGMSAISILDAQKRREKGPHGPITN